MIRSGWISVFIAFFCLQSGIAQEYYLPYNIKKAYQNKTRSFSGKPASNYFQNSANYKIDVNFDPEKGIIKGTEKITYINASPDSIYYMVIRLYYDMLKKGNIRDNQIAPECITDGVNITSLSVEGTQYVGNEMIFKKRSGTNMTIALPRDLPPGDSITLKISWNSEIPHAHVHRFGNYGPSDWFVGYWYPQIAVYDDIDGWDEINYTGQYEFYNDFNNYDIEITVPSGTLVWATGKWENPEDILSQEVYDKYRKSETSDKTIHVVTAGDWGKKNVFLKSKRLRYKFLVRNITDFAFAVSDSYVWDAVSVITDSVNNMWVTVNAVYPKEEHVFKDVAEIGAKSIQQFSFVSLGLPYPFPKVTVFNGEGGMEYPMMVNERSADYHENLFVTMHEIFHGYFPFYTGNNERKYAWMDEGLTSYLPMETETVLGGNYFQFPFVCRYYSNFAGMDVESPLMVPSVQTRDENYYHQAYYRSSVAYGMLEQYLGRETFRSFIRYFVKQWNGKHPTGYDFVFLLNEFTGENLYWLVNPWFFEPGWADIAIESADVKNNQLEISVENVGGLPVPLNVNVTLTDGSIVKKDFKADVWKNNPKKVILKIDSIPDYKQVYIGSPFVPDKEPKNNSIQK